MPTTFSSGLLKVVHEDETIRPLIGELMPRDEQRLDFCPMTQSHEVGATLDDVDDLLERDWEKGALSLRIWLVS